MDLVKTAVSYMTFQRFYRYLLKRILGGVLLPEFTLEQLDVQLYKGIVQLTDVAINSVKINALLRSRNIPVIVRAGTVSKLRVKIPWISILKEKCQLYISEVTLDVSMDSGRRSFGTANHHRAEVDGDSHGRPDAPDSVRALTQLVQQVLMNIEACVDRVIVNVEGEHRLTFETSHILVQSNSPTLKLCRIGQSSLYLQSRFGSSRIADIGPVEVQLSLDEPEVANLSVSVDLISLAVDKKRTLRSMLELVSRWKTRLRADDDSSTMYHSIMEDPDGRNCPNIESTGPPKLWYEEIYSVIEAEVIRSGSEPEQADPGLMMKEESVVDGSLSVQPEKPGSSRRTIKPKIVVKRVVVSLLDREEDSPALAMSLYGISASDEIITIKDYEAHFATVRIPSQVDMFVSSMSGVMPRSQSDGAGSWATSVYESAADSDEESFADSVIETDVPDVEESVDESGCMDNSNDEHVEREHLFFSTDGLLSLRRIDEAEFMAQSAHPPPRGDRIVYPNTQCDVAIDVQRGSTIHAIVTQTVAVSLRPDMIGNLSLLSQVVGTCVEASGIRDIPSFSLNADDAVSYHVSLPSGVAIDIPLGNGHLLEFIADGPVMYDSVTGGSIPTIRAVCDSRAVALEACSIEFWVKRTPEPVTEPDMASSVNSSRSKGSSTDDRFGIGWTAVPPTRKTSRPSPARSAPREPPVPKTDKSIAEESSEAVKARCGQVALIEVVARTSHVKVTDSAIALLDFQLKLQSLIDQISLTTVSIQDALGIQSGPGLLSPRSLQAATARPSLGISLLLGEMSLTAVRLIGTTARLVVAAGHPLLSVLVSDCRVTTDEQLDVCRPCTRRSSRDPITVPQCTMSFEQDVLPIFVLADTTSVIRVTLEVSSLPALPQPTSRICLAVDVRGLHLTFTPELIPFYQDLAAYFAPPVALVTHAAPLITAPPRPTFTVYIVRVNETLVDWPDIPSSGITAAAVILDGLETSSGVVSTVDARTPAGIALQAGRIGVWLAKKVWTDNPMSSCLPGKALPALLRERGFVEVISVSNSRGVWKWRGDEVVDLDLSLGVVRADVRADTYAGIAGLIPTFTTVFESIRFRDPVDAPPPISTPPMCRPQAATFTIKENFIQTRTAGRGGSRWARPAVVAEPAPSSELGARWLVDPKQVSVVHDHLASVAVVSVRSEAESRVKSSGGRLRMTSVSVSINSVRIYVHGGFDWEGTEFHLAGLLKGRKRRWASAPLSFVCAELDSAVVSFVRVVPRVSAIGAKDDEASVHFSATAGDVRVRDGVVGSVYQFLVGPWTGPGVPLRSSAAGQVALRYTKTAGPARAEATVLPLCVTLDQDTLEFLSKFVTQTVVLGFRAEDPAVQLMFDDDADDATEGDEDGDEASEGVGESPVSQPTDTTTAITSDVHVWLQSLQVSPIDVEINYRSKRLSMAGLRRGDPLQLINLVPVLEGLRVPLAEVRMVDLLGPDDLLTRLRANWARDINRAQILRSLSGVAPLRSLTNLSVGVSDLISQPLKQARRKDGHVSRGVLRGVSMFLRTLTIESLNLADVVVSSAHSALEFVDENLSSGRDVRVDVPADQIDWESDDSESESGASDWTAVERGAREGVLDPASAVEGLRTGSDALIRGLRSTTRRDRRGPSLILQPMMGAAEAVCVVLRGARSSVDAGRRRAETERRFKGPHTQESPLR